MILLILPACCFILSLFKKKVRSPSQFRLVGKGITSILQVGPPAKDGGCNVLDLEWAKEAGDPPSGTVTVSKPPSETSSIALSLNFGKGVYAMAGNVAKKMQKKTKKNRVPMDLTNLALSHVEPFLN